MEIIMKAFYCEQCCIHFDQKSLYNLHLEIKHKQEIKIKKETKICENEETKPNISVQCKFCEADFLTKKGPEETCY